MNAFFNNVKKRLLQLNFLVRNSFQIKILICFLLASLLPIMIMSYFTYTGMLNKYMSQYAESVQENIYNLSNSTDRYYSSIQQSLQVIYNSNKYMDLLAQRGPYNYDIEQQLVTSALSLYYNNSDINNFMLYTYYNNTLLTMTRKFGFAEYSIIPYQDINVYLPFSSKLNLDRRFYLTPLHSSIDSTEVNGPYFTMNQLITDIPSNIYAAIISVDISMATMDNIYQGVKIIPGESLFVLDEDKDPLYIKGNSSNKIFDTNKLFSDINIPSNQGYMNCKIKGINYLLFYSKLKNHPYTLVRMIPINDLKTSITFIIIKSLWINVIFIALIPFIIILLSYQLTKPINKLALYMRDVGEGQFGKHIENVKADIEIKVLIDRFNTMTDQINHLFNETYRLQVSQKSADFRALQAQINPHFLYNTLQTIHYMALKRNAYEINAMVDALGGTLKYCLKNKDSIVKLEDELENVKKYVLIQRFRYMNKLKVSFMVEDELLELKLPKMILQPLVENSILHGFEEGESNCNVEVRCYTEDGKEIIEISDNGKGIEKDKLESIIKSLKEDEDLSSGSIGLFSCYERLKFLYDKRFCFEIESKQGEGTTIRIIIYSGEGGGS